MVVDIKKEKKISRTSRTTPLRLQAKCMAKIPNMDQASPSIEELQLGTINVRQSV